MAQNDKNSQTDLDGLEKMGMPDGQPRPIACLPIIGQIEGHSGAFGLEQNDQI